MIVLVGRQHFTKLELTLMSREFFQHINVKQKCPSKHEVLQFLQQHPIRSTEDWAKVKYWVKNQFGKKQPNLNQTIKFS